VAKGKVRAAGEGGRYKPLELKVAVAKAYVAGEATAAELSKVYGVSASTIYGWAELYREHGEKGLAEMRGTPRAPKPDPVRGKLAQEILKTKKQFSWFGIPRITQWLRRTQLLPVTESQVKKTLKEANLVPKKPKKRRRAEVVRFFERAEPNQLWQTDITMWTIARGQKVYVIGFLDDYSRYMVGWGLHAAQGSSQVLEVFRNAIGQYGAPKEILSDQGRQYYSWRGKCPFQKELAREGIHHIVSRSHHPQTLGKIESFWKHLKEEFLDRVVSGSINDLRERLRLWIDSFYNFQRPHQGIDGAAPADRFFKMSDAVRATIEKGVRENAERLAVGKEPIKPFYMVGRMGDQSVVIQQQGTEVVVNVGNRELEKINLTEDGHAEKKEPVGTSGRGEAGSEGAGDRGATGALRREDDQRNLPGDRPQADPVLQARGPAPEGDGHGGGGESGGGTSTQPASGVAGPGGAQPPAPAGSAPQSVDAPADAQALQNKPQGPEKRPQTGEAAEGDRAGEAGAGSGGRS
jgi:transposase InsO family protein